MPRFLLVGEVLWDALPRGLFLGGAPFNVAAHLQRLGEPVRLVTRVGADELGREARRRIAATGLDASGVQTDPSLPTGFVRVGVDASGDARYDILAPAAWDAIAPPEAGAEVVVFGTLAQRDARSRAAIRGLWRGARVRVLDLNLRPPHVSPEVIEASLRAADIVKLNAEELKALREQFALASGGAMALRDLAERFSLASVCVTRGARGARLLHDGEAFDHAGCAAEVRDTVGAGDAFLAALLSGLFRGDPPADVLDRANRLGAQVAGVEGALLPA
ncbi:carbohydrate kinase family protein [Rubricoccus marinus]|uniref:Carbohydrate kinase PfkB domain-containing protein n=1 Tax=Rubricoccus marinus TaxID=716817 RepID=A0A259TZ08_9BACT|nr:carbohydrate kinase [Rubricoccus marinus]OZC02989.1 hypothetical protein BSZ36_08400 [Rubricoccus marinus]